MHLYPILKTEGSPDFVLSCFRWSIFFFKSFWPEIKIFKLDFLANASSEAQKDEIWLSLWFLDWIWMHLMRIRSRCRASVVRTPVKRQRSDLSEPSKGSPPGSRSPRYPTTPNFSGWTDEEARRSKSSRQALLQTPTKIFKGDSCYLLQNRYS